MKREIKKFIYINLCLKALNYCTYHGGVLSFDDRTKVHSEMRKAKTQFQKTMDFDLPPAVVELLEKIVAENYQIKRMNYNANRELCYYNSDTEKVEIINPNK